MRGESELLDLRGLRGHSQPLAIALHKNISPHVMVAGFLAVSHDDFIVGAGDLRQARTATNALFAGFLHETLLEIG